MVQFEDQIFEIPACSGIFTNNFEFSLLFEQYADHNWIQTNDFECRLSPDIAKLREEGIDI